METKIKVDSKMFEINEEIFEEAVRMMNYRSCMENRKEPEFDGGDVE